MSLQDSPQSAGVQGNAERSEVEDLRAATAANFNPKPGPNHDHGMATAAENTVVNTTAMSANALAASTSNADAAPMVAPNAALTSALSFFPARVAKQMPQQHAPSSGLTLPSAGVSEADGSFAASLGDLGPWGTYAPKARKQLRPGPPSAILT